MLVIRRRAGESLLIAGNIEIEILETGPGQVKLGITAPRDVPILRKEVLLVSAENETAARVASVDSLVSLARYLKIPSNSSSKTEDASR
jgi:carbon storage regulator